MSEHPAVVTCRVYIVDIPSPLCSKICFIWSSAGTVFKQTCFQLFFQLFILDLVLLWLLYLMFDILDVDSVGTYLRP
jgi:hypothetical protein